jgi:hypothetical protein
MPGLPGFATGVVRACYTAFVTVYPHGLPYPSLGNQNLPSLYRASLPASPIAGRPSTFLERGPIGQQEGLESVDIPLASMNPGAYNEDLRRIQAVKRGLPTMRFPIPLVPLAVSIRLESRARDRFRLSRLRLRLRTMIILVAIVALIMTGIAERERRGEQLRRGKSYAQLAQRYAKAESFHEWAASLGKHLIVTFGDVRGYRTVRLEVPELKKVAEDEGLMRMKYERAAENPWLPIEPDPRVSELERLADEKGVPQSMSPPTFPLVLDPHPTSP